MQSARVRSLEFRTREQLVYEFLRRAITEGRWGPNDPIVGSRVAEELGVSRITIANALKRLAAQFGTSISTVFSTRAAIEELVRRADLLIGTVLVPGAAAPKLVTKEMVKAMKQGAVIVDVAIDQGGCVETSHATTHADPTYVVDGVVHYCVANMPGAVARRCHVPGGTS